MHIIVSERVKKEYGARIRAAAPGAKLVTLSVRDGKAHWAGNPALADVCCFSEDFWQDPELRRRAIPELFRLEGLRWFHTFSAGVDAPAFAVLAEQDTIVTNSPGASAPSIAQHVLGMMLSVNKRFAEFREQQARREWKQLPGSDLSGKTCGIIGTGQIGGEVARLAKACGMATLGIRRSGKPARYVDEMLPSSKLRTLLRRSDFVVIACPLTRETECLIGAPELAAMRPHAVLINVARGRIVDEAELIAALQERRIAAACLDVFTVEPLPETSPLWELPNVWITPHNAGVSPLNMRRAMAIFLDNLSRLAAGKPLRNRVLG